MRVSPSISLLAILLSVSVGACSGSDGGTLVGNGGALAAGGVSAGGANSSNGGVGGTSTGGPTGGVFVVGGSTGTGGATSTGSTSATGGVSTSGGTSAGGTAVSTGGTTAKGGTTNAGGTTAKGGTSSTGGTTAKGGTTGTGGTTTQGGGSSTGGTTSKGGTSSTGGASAVGGASTGGTTSKGGTSSTGGTSSAGGTTSTTFTCKNLLSAAGATGQAKPSGAVGGLKVLNWAGFKGAVSFTFDDNQQTQVDNIAALKATGAKMTFFIVSGWGNAANAAYVTASKEGHEIGNHTSNHNTTGDISTAQTCQTFISSNYGLTAYTMASPEGKAAWVTSAPQLFFANRGVNDGLIAPRDSTNAFSLPAYLPPTNASSSTMDTAVNLARTGGSWKIFCVHGFDINNTSIWQPVTIGNMTTTMSNAVKSGDMWVDTMMNVAAYWLGQKAISASATTSATWTLPAHFPPNMCVRVTTTGGTVKQNGAAVPWNDHGYYEISLDAKSVTVE